MIGFRVLLESRVSGMHTAKRWQDATLPAFLVQQLISTVGAMVAGVLAALIPAGLNALTKFGV